MPAKIWQRLLAEPRSEPRQKQITRNARRRKHCGESHRAYSQRSRRCDEDFHRHGDNRYERRHEYGQKTVFLKPGPKTRAPRGQSVTMEVCFAALARQVKNEQATDQ